ncbi:MAG: VCBS repeat-containing protein [Acidobacteriota bacterium]|jgi:hypothetical protein
MTTIETLLQSIRRPGRGASRRTLLSICCLVAVVALGCAGRSVASPAQSVGGGGPEPTASAEAADPAAPVRGGGELEGPPDGQWKVDERGREYYELEIERKPEYTFRRDGWVMVPPGIALELAEVRDDTLLVKIYNPESVERNDAFRLQPRESRIEDLLDLEIEVADRLRFEPFGADLPSRGQWRQGFELADMDGDENLDIVHGPLRKGDGIPKILLGDGAGGWRLWRDARFEGHPLDYGDVAVADFNADGTPDLAFAVHLRGLQVMVGDGRGHFRRWGEELPYWNPGSGEDLPPFSSRTVRALDWDGDGRTDLLTLGEGPRILRDPGATVPSVNRGDRGAILFLNRGDGEWERYDQGTGRRQIFGDDLALGDFNGDGITDFAVGSRVSGATRIVKLGREDGSWEDVSLAELVRPGIYSSVHAVDLDGDGRHELLAGFAVSGDGDERWSGLDLLEVGEDGWTRTALLAEKGAHGGVTALATGDLDGDSHLDVVALTASGDRWILLGAPDGGFVREASDELAPEHPGCQGYSVRIARIGPGGDDRRTLVLMGFAGESGSEKLIPGLRPRCPSGGGLEAWVPTPRD